MNSNIYGPWLQTSGHRGQKEGNSEPQLVTSVLLVQEIRVHGRWAKREGFSHTDRRFDLGEDHHAAISK